MRRARTSPSLERAYALTRIAKARIEAGQKDAAAHPIERAIGLAKTVREPEGRLEAVLKISELQAEKLQDARGALATVALLEDAGARDRATTAVVKGLAAGGAVDEAREQVNGIQSRRLLVSAWSEIAKAEVQRDREAAAQEALGHGRAAVDQIADARERSGWGRASSPCDRRR